MIRMELGKDSYDIILFRGSLMMAKEHLNLQRKVMIITDEGVPSQYAEVIAKQCKEPFIKVVAQGEGSKSLQTVESILTKMLEYLLPLRIHALPSTPHHRRAARRGPCTY